MENSVATQPSADYEAMLQQLLMEMTQINEQMQSDRIEINRFKEESSRLKAETRALLASIGAKL